MLSGNTKKEIEKLLKTANREINDVFMDMIIAQDIENRGGLEKLAHLRVIAKKMILELPNDLSAIDVVIICNLNYRATLESLRCLVLEAKKKVENK